MIKDFRQLLKLRRTENCVFLGSGSSINNITPEQWQRIKHYDIWTVNNWVYHTSIVPNFYHVEAKWYDYNILKRRFHEKRRLYKDVNFIFPKGKSIRLKDDKRVLLSDIVFSNANKFDYEMQPRDHKRTDKVFNANYKIKGKLTKSYDMSLTAIFEMLFRFEYQNITTFGIDLYNSYYFWTGRPECGEVHHQTNKSHEGKDPEMPHATVKIWQFIVDFNKRWMQPAGREICVGHDDTMLSKFLRKNKI